ncbi:MULTISPECIES: hypothetical protein [Mycolicibacterium]|uniref:Uncharacterized protein n=2 Tax=Mycolicibacterium TaxID=1866885 RepID=A0AAE5ADQ6_MYCFO|nr:hypothetical protein [Mycolicibacterium fortuitum]OCB46686.1 hypothetical protein A5721_10870 [Mycolicibacterium vulneris]MDV7192607.1 hypothetical protein [Mycolicibacterium fortuitum]MDV7205508.1 hypothetical protein [Mycolicibacterium fortuitum]MDV7227089.1 hypothetical protein [Mycolicibacterium fortuitum]MDV7259666.1 hypothetical protein [Mycolicibacterium fortuitum]
MQIEPSARKHGISDDAMLHAVANAIRVIEQEYHGEIRQLVIGADYTARLLEIVVVTDEPVRIIHADVLRPKFYDYL